MLCVPMEVPSGSGEWWRGSGSAVCRQPEPWEVVQEEMIGILVEAKKEGKRRKIPVLATVGSVAVLFGKTPLSSNSRGQARAVVSAATGFWMW